MKSKGWWSFLLVGLLLALPGCNETGGSEIDDDDTSEAVDPIDDDDSASDDDDSAGDDDDSAAAAEVDGDADGFSAEEDCNDDNAAVNPAATELCDSIDNDCDGATDEAGAADADTWYEDTDGDGYGVEGTSEQACNQPHGYSAHPGDCDDTNPSYHPGATEADCTDPADYNCDLSTGYADVDGDDEPACEDCNDNDININSAATESCNAVDDDCDGLIDEAGATGESTWYLDADEDNYGRSSLSQLSCTQPAGYVANSGDCDDLEPLAYPGATEVCDEIDNNCTGGIDEGAAAPQVWYADADGDDFGNLQSSTVACSAPFGAVADATDCDDLDASSFPGNPEVCDGADNNCDNQVDEGVTNTYFGDADGDGYGDPGAPIAACFLPGASSISNQDCDDGNPSVHPGGIELCDGLDNDCDNQVDNSPLNACTWYADLNGNGLGDPATSTVACNQPTGHVANADDCDDSIAVSTDINADGDCDGTLTAADCDDGDDTSTVVAEDGDCDGTLTAADCDDGDPSSTLVAEDGDCDGTLTTADCDDSVPTITVCRTCNDILLGGLSVGDDDYTIEPILGDPFVVACDMTTDGGGWTEIAYSLDLPFQAHSTVDADEYQFLDQDFSLELSTARISAIQSLSTEGRQRYVGICDDVIHYLYSASGGHEYAFGFRFLDGTETPRGSASYSPHSITVPQDGCAANNASGNTAATGTWFDIDSVLVPVINVQSRDNQPSEEYGSPLTSNPAWLR